MLGVLCTRCPRTHNQLVMHVIHMHTGINRDNSLANKRIGFKFVLPSSRPHSSTPLCCKSAQHSSVCATPPKSIYIAHPAAPAIISWQQVTKPQFGHQTVPSRNQFPDKSSGQMNTRYLMNQNGACVHEYMQVNWCRTSSTTPVLNVGKMAHMHTIQGDYHHSLFLIVLSTSVNCYGSMLSYDRTKSTATMCTYVLHVGVIASVSVGASSHRKAQSDPCQ